MLKVSQLLKFISDLNPQNTPTRLSFFNFLKGFSFPDDDLTPDLIEKFFFYCMDYPHWASNKQQLGNEIHFLLENFNSFYQKKFDLSAIRFPQQIQLIEMENFSDVVDAVSLYLTTQYTDEDKVRILPDQNKRLIAIILRADKTLEVRTFDKKFVIRSGALRPLRDDLILYYTPNLELSPRHTQKVEVAPYITAQFTIFDERVTGAFIRGYVSRSLLNLKTKSSRNRRDCCFRLSELSSFSWIVAQILTTRI